MYDQSPQTSLSGAHERLAALRAETKTGITGLRRDLLGYLRQCQLHRKTSVCTGIYQEIHKFILQFWQFLQAGKTFGLCNGGNCVAAQRLDLHKGNTPMVLEKAFKIKIRLILHAALYLSNSSGREFLIPEQTYFLLRVAIIYFICGAGDYVAAFQ